MAKGLEILKGEIIGKKFFGGDAPGYLDIMVRWIAYWLHFSQQAGGYNWMKNFLQVDIINNNLPPFEVMMSTYKIYRELSLSFLKVEEE
ncbi:Glutathione transferase [Handroanthus impetiginosus]|uniref:Glutathione transferase n=1 Tax=Handroanthus impetiginosus TaxID=429701 RepID=A0A2G9GNY3_9LAMI|nr:Glutathione transferase [Handroanthus impetiginosus]